MTASFPKVSFDLQDWLVSSTYLVALQAFQGNQCHWCGDTKHSKRCGPGCRCDSSYTRLDDTWRPSLLGDPKGRRSKIMAETGCDGWTAQECLPPSPSTTELLRRCSRITGLLYGEK